MMCAYVYMYTFSGKCEYERIQILNVREKRKKLLELGIIDDLEEFKKVVVKPKKKKKLLKDPTLKRQRVSERLRNKTHPGNYLFMT